MIPLRSLSKFFNCFSKKTELISSKKSVTAMNCFLRILTRFIYPTLLSNFKKSIDPNRSRSTLHTNRFPICFQTVTGGEVLGPHAWYPRQTYSPRTGTTPKESRSRKSRGTREINQAGRRVKWTETRFGAIKGPSTN